PPVRAALGAPNCPARAFSSAGRTAGALAAAAARIRSRKKPSTCGVSTDDLSKLSIFDANTIGADGRIATVPAPGADIAGIARVTRNGRTTWPTLRPPTVTTARAT